MSDARHDLLEAFRGDHATIGRGLYHLARALRDGDMLSAKRIAAELDFDAGPHIAFEERYYYPALRDLIDPDDVDRFYAEHEAGRNALAKILAMPDEAWPDPRQTAPLLAQIELMERHVAECGALFGATAGLSRKEQLRMLDHLKALRDSPLRWTRLETRAETR